jgi:hypothetical protein
MALNSTKNLYLNNLEDIKIRKKSEISPDEIYQSFKDKYKIENKYLFDLAYKNCHDADEAEILMNEYVENGEIFSNQIEEEDNEEKKAIFDSKSKNIDELTLSHLNIVVQILTKYAKGNL